MLVSLLQALVVTLSLEALNLDSFTGLVTASIGPIGPKCQVCVQLFLPLADAGIKLALDTPSKIDTAIS